jgi:hypothetical protein
MTDRLAITQPRVATRKMTHSLRAYGGTERVNMGTTSVLEEALRDKITVICVLKPNKLVGGTIFNKRDGASPYFDVGMGFYTSTGKANFRVRNSDGDGVHAVADTSMILGAWNWLCGTYDGSAVKLYTNEELATAQPELTGNIHAANNQLGLFNFANTASSIDANIAYFAIFDYAFTQEQWNNFRLYGILPSERPLVEYLKNHDTDGVGTTVKNTGKLGEALDGSSSATWTTETPLKEKVAVPSVMPHVLSFSSATTDDVVIENSSGEVVSDLSQITVRAKFMKKGLTGGTQFIFAVPALSDNNRRYIAFDDNDELDITMGSSKKFIATIEQNKLYDCVVTFDKTNDTSRVYFDGELIKEHTSFGTIGSSLADIVFGNNGQTSTNGLFGTVDSPTMWSRILTPTEIYNLHHYNIIPENGLVGNWDRISDDGTKLLNSADPTGATDGTISGATRVTEPLALGRTPREAIVPYVGSVSGDGVNGEVVLTDSASLRPTTAITTDVIFRKDNLGVSSILFGRPAGTTDYLPTIQNTNDFRFNLKLSITNVNFNTSGVYAVQKNKWTRVTCTYDSATGLAYIYVDGILVKSGTGAGTITNPGDWKVLGSSGLGFVDGEVAQVRMYNRALTTEEAETLNLTNTTPYDNDPSICVLNLEAKSGVLSGSTWRDISGNNNHGTITGATLSAEAPSKKRKVVDGNVIPWSFDDIPVIAGGEYNGRTTNGYFPTDLLSYYFPLVYYIIDAGAGKGTIMRENDKNFLRVEATDVDGNVTLFLGGAQGAQIPIKPNTAYKFTALVRTNNVQPDGLFIDFSERKADGNQSAYTRTNKLSGTADWREVTCTFTTASTSVKAYIYVRLDEEGAIQYADVKDLRLEEI